MFQQKWHWSLGITERVKAKFVAKAKIRLCNTVSDWKDKWEIYGYERKPTELTTDVWDGLIAYWEHPLRSKRPIRARLLEGRRIKMVICPCFTEPDKNLMQESV